MSIKWKNVAIVSILLLFALSVLFGAGNVLEFLLFPFLAEFRTFGGRCRALLGYAVVGVILISIINACFPQRDGNGDS